MPARDASHHCEGHLHFEDSDETDERLDEFLARLRSADTSALIDPALQQVIDRLGSDRSLQSETGILRLALYRLVATGVLEGEPKDFVPLLTRLSDAIGRAERTRQAIAAGQPGDLQEAIDKVFGELGLDGMP